MSKLLSLLTPCWRWRKSPRVAPRKARPAIDEERPLGCGWFDSSHELVRGLVVHETAAESLGTLPLGDWLDFELAGWGAAATLA